MLPKSYVVFKWAVYAAATLLLCALQSMALNQIHALGLTPFLYPMLPALVAMFEGPRRGAFCDKAPFERSCQPQAD